MSSLSPRRFWSAVVMVALSLGTGLAFAQAPFKPDDQREWVGKGYTFTKNDDGSWTETGPNGMITLKALLHKPTRCALVDDNGRKIMLTGDAVHISEPGKNDFTIPGKWTPVAQIKKTSPSARPPRAGKIPPEEKDGDTREPPTPAANHSSVTPAPAATTAVAKLKPKSTLPSWATKEFRALHYLGKGDLLATAPDMKKLVFFKTKELEYAAEMATLNGACTQLLPGLRPDTLIYAEGFLIRHMDVTSGQELKVYGSGFGLSRVAVPTRQPGVIAFGSAGGGVEIADMNTGRSLMLYQIDVQPKRSDEVRSSAVAIAVDGKTVYGARGDGRVFSWNLTSNKEQPLSSFLAHTGRVAQLLDTREGLLSPGLDGKLLRWNLKTGQSTTLYDAGEVLNLAQLVIGVSHLALVRKANPTQLELIDVGQKQAVGTFALDSLFTNPHPEHKPRFEVTAQTISPTHEWAIAVKCEVHGEQLAALATFDLSKFAAATKPAAATTTLKSTEPATGEGNVSGFRLFKSADGKFQVQARFIRFDGDKVVLRRQDTEREIAVPMKNFSLADQKYFAEQKE